MIKIFLKELEQEAKTTRKMLSRIPEDKFNWQPHEISMTIKRLATHIAELPGWVSMSLTTDGLDFAGNPYKQEDMNTTQELLAYFDRSVSAGIESLKTADEKALSKTWTLREGDKIYSQDTKADVIRMSLNQTVHHRAQLGVYLRLLDVPIPGSYGPSADEMEF
jgi:uncharacterized damage-inducible protein DinB